MATYIVKRILLMVPTFFAVSLIVFFVLNFAPGNPAAVALASGNADAGQNSQNSQERESYRLFKEQFNLDRPILLNSWFLLGRDDVQEAIEALLDPGSSFAQRDRAAEGLENWGPYAVRGLVDLVGDATAPLPVRAMASNRLTSAAARRLVVRGRGPLTPEQRDWNAAVKAETLAMKAWRFGPDASEAEAAGIAAQWRSWLDDNAARFDWNPASVLLLDTRFARYWGNLIRLDFGVSHVDRQPVIDKVFSKLKYSLTLSTLSVLLVYFVSVPLGIWSAVRRDSMADRVVTVGLFMLYSLPSFFVGVFLLNLLTRGTPFSIFPTARFESLDSDHMTGLQALADVAWHVVLPIVCMSYASLAALSRYARTGLLDVIRADYIRTARAKGLPEIVVVLKHAARNGMIPILTLLATLLPTLIGGSVVVEVVFGIPGMGRYMFESINMRDYNAVMAVLLISCGLTLVGMLLSDISYALVDPRISFD